MVSVRLEGVRKSFAYHGRRAPSLKEAAVRLLKGQRNALRIDRFVALHDVSFEIREGEAFGIVGSNGSGKSTLLKLIAGISKPDSGVVAVHGRISALLELGAGIHPDFSGRENVYMYGALLGLNRKLIRSRMDEIESFADIGEFIDEPVRTYSSGMAMRLAFAIAINVDPDILILDEVLAVGDAAFQAKCVDRIHAFRMAGKTILFVSHDADAVVRLCDRALWLDRGHVRIVGAPQTVVDAYQTGVVPASADAVGEPLPAG